MLVLLLHWVIRGLWTSPLSTTPTSSWHLLSFPELPKGVEYTLCFKTSPTQLAPKPSLPKTAAEKEGSWKPIQETSDTWESIFGEAGTNCLSNGGPWIWHTPTTNGDSKRGQMHWVCGQWGGKGDIQMAKGHMKRYLASLITREMQIKTLMSYHFTLVRMASVKKTKNSKC